MCWVAREIEVNLVCLKEGTVDGIRIGIQTAADGIHATKYEQPW